MKTILRLGLILQLLVASAALAAEPPATSAPEGIANFGRVNADLYRGAQPDARGIQALARLGVKSIINLRTTSKAVSAEAAQAHTAGILFTNLPLSGTSRPTDAEVAKVLRLVETLPQPVFVHCQRGADRTGLIVACYRIQHDHWRGDQALLEAKRFKMSALELGMKKYIRDFAKTHPAK